MYRGTHTTDPRELAFPLGSLLEN